MTKKKRLYISIYNEISELIKSGDFPVGSRLPTERELSERFKVSRPTIREAIIALEAKEEVSVKANSGVYVLGSNLADDDFTREISAFELLEARVILESEAAAMAARTRSEEELSDLASALGDMELEGKEDISSSGADRRFHTIIAKATHNRLISKQIMYLWDIQENFEHINHAHNSVCVNDLSSRIDDHAEIYDAIKNQNSSKAREVMKLHFSDLLETMHNVSEREAFEETKRRATKLRARFSISELSD